jgi:hypothetical protein
VKCVVWRNCHFDYCASWAANSGLWYCGKKKRLRLLENWVLTEVFGRKGGKVTGNCSKLRYGELCDFVRLAKCYLGDQFKEE